METNLAAGRVLSGRYLVDELLGIGGMAAVWRGRDLRLDRPVAIKELAGPWLGDRTAVERFDREARTTARLAHPNIVAVHDVGIHDGSRYLVMELIEGVTVAEMLTNGPLSVMRVIAIAVQVCDGLTAAHAVGIIHRDIKPANLLVTAAGVVKICDFGIARAIIDTADTSLTGPMFAMGSTKYMAPEQAYGQVDARADLYALGCTMYAMLTGSAPFAGDPAELLHQHLSQSPTPLLEHRADIAESLAALVAQLLAKTPAARPANAAEVRARLEAVGQYPSTAATQLPAQALIALSKVAEPVAIPAPRSAHLPGSARATAPPTANSPVRAWSNGTWRLAAGVMVALAAVATSFVVASRSVPGGLVGPHAVWVPALEHTTAASVTASPKPPAASLTSPTVELGRPVPSDVAVSTTSQASPADPIAAMRLSVQLQVNIGNLNPDKASDLYKKTDEIARAMADGNVDEAAKRVKELRDRLSNLLGGGQLAAAGYDTLIRNLESIAAVIP